MKPMLALAVVLLVACERAGTTLPGPASPQPPDGPFRVPGEVVNWEVVRNGGVSQLCWNAHRDNAGVFACNDAGVSFDAQPYLVHSPALIPPPTDVRKRATGDGGVAIMQLAWLEQSDAHPQYTFIDPTHAPVALKAHWNYVGRDFAYFPDRDEVVLSLESDWSLECPYPNAALLVGGLLASPTEWCLEQKAQSAPAIPTLHQTRRLLAMANVDGVRLWDYSGGQPAVVCDATGFRPTSDGFFEYQSATFHVRGSADGGANQWFAISPGDGGTCTTARSAFDGVLHLARYDQPGVDGSTLVTGPSIERPKDYAVSSVADNVLGRTLFSPAAEQLQVVEEGAQVAVWLQERDDAGIRTLRRVVLTPP